jgi:hypothetical protein
LGNVETTKQYIFEKIRYSTIVTASVYGIEIGIF